MHLQQLQPGEQPEQVREAGEPAAAISERHQAQQHDDQGHRHAIGPPLPLLFQLS